MTAERTPSPTIPPYLAPFQEAVSQAALRAATYQIVDDYGRPVERIDYAAIPNIRAWLWRWINNKWLTREWLKLDPSHVAGKALHAWQHCDDNPYRYRQATLL